MRYNIIRRSTVDTSHLPADVSPLLKQIYAARGAQAVDCDLSLKGLLHPNTMKGIKTAASLVADAIIARQKIMIMGDFDADGATSTCVCLLALNMMGATRCDYLIPNRFDYGYGLSPEIVSVAHAKQAQLLITVDNGISSVEGVKAAKALGMTVVITDHHLPGNELPNADAIVNPNQPDCSFASKALAGVGVAFYLMSALRAELRNRNWFQTNNIADPNLGQLLDLVALGTVADVVTLDTNNRILVNAGLKRIRAGQGRVGIVALLDIARRSPHRVVAADFGFAVGPRLNAAGRLDEMALGVETLLCNDKVKARQMAGELDSLNAERRELEAGMQQEAQHHLAQLKLDSTQLPWGIAIYQPDWHQGVIGILASRIKDKYHRPVIAFAEASEDEIKGSARSIKGLHIRDLLDLIQRQHPELISKFGGHAMAAGLTIPKAALAEFVTVFDDTVKMLLNEEDLAGEIISDGELPLEYLTLDVAHQLRDAGPWGQGFPEPLFDGKYVIIQQRIVGEKHLKLVLETPCGTKMVDAIAFNVDLKIWPDPTIKNVHIVYKLDVNEYKGNQQLQLLVDQIMPILK